MKRLTLESVPPFDKYASWSSLAFQIQLGSFRTLQMTKFNVPQSAVSNFLDAYFTEHSPTKHFNISYGTEIKMALFDLAITLFTFQVLRIDFYELQCHLISRIFNITL